MNARSSKNYNIDMSTGSLPKKMLLFALPLIFSSILQLLFNAADLIVVGRCVGDEALAAVKTDLQALHSGVTVSRAEYDEVVVVKPMFLVSDYQ